MHFLVARSIQSCDDETVQWEDSRQVEKLGLQVDYTLSGFSTTWVSLCFVCYLNRVLLLRSQWEVNSWC